MHRRGYEHALRELPESLRRAFLVAFLPTAQLDKAARDRIKHYVRFWLGSLSFDYHLNLYREWRNDHYPLGYRSPRERELLSIVDDDSRSERKRLDAADQLARIELKRLEDDVKKHEQIDHFEWWLQERARGSRGKGVWIRRCSKHEIRGCSQCYSPRPRPVDLPGRYEALAWEEGWDPGELKAPSRQGRPPGQGERLDALGRVVTSLHEEGFTLEQIGREIGRSHQRISSLRKRAI